MSAERADDLVSVGAASDAAVQYMVEKNPGIGDYHDAELTRKAEAGEFSLGPMLMALIGGRKREQKRA